jgi:hypothetical protein
MTPSEQTACQYREPETVSHDFLQENEDLVHLIGEESD